MMLKCLHVGMGVRSRQWARVIHKRNDIETVGYVRQQVEKASATTKEWGVPDRPCYKTVEEGILALKPDIVLLVTPPETHHEQVSAAFKYNCHVIAEKPLSEILDESIDMVKQADSKNLKLMVGHNFRYLAVNQEIKQKIQTEELGKIGFSNFNYTRHRNGNRHDLNSYPLTMPYPMLLEQSIHHLDLLRYCFNDEVKTLSAHSFHPTWSSYKNDCCVSVLMEFNRGFHVNYMGTWTSGSNQFRFNWRTDLSKGILVQTEQFDKLYQSEFEASLALEGENFKTSDDTQPLQKVNLKECKAFYDDTDLMLTEFIDSVVKDTPLITSGKDHIRTLGLTLACCEAAEQEKRINLNDFLLTKGVPAEWLK